MKSQKLLQKSISWFMVFLLGALFPVCPEKAVAAPIVPITAQSAILLDPFTSQAVYSKTPHLRRAPASTTKILTSIVVLDHLSLGGRVSVPAFVEKIQPSKIHLRRREQYYVRDLVKALLLSSANDAAETLAVATGGSSGNFASMMNRKARSIGASSSHFVNASGLPAAGQYSTAYDMALIMRKAQQYPFIVAAMKTKTCVIRSVSGRRIRLYNHNKLLGKLKWEVLGKTGWTRSAKHCFVGRFNFHGNQVLISMLGSKRLWKDVKLLASYQFGTAFFRIRKNRNIWSRKDTEEIQWSLKRAGFDPGPVDGIYGGRTVQAVKRFQSAHHLPEDGVITPQTRQQLMGS